MPDLQHSRTQRISLLSMFFQPEICQFLVWSPICTQPINGGPKFPNMLSTQPINARLAIQSSKTRTLHHLWLLYPMF